MAHEYVRVRGVPAANLIELDCPTVNEISRKEYEQLILQPLKKVSLDQVWWRPSGLASSPMRDRKIYALLLMADLPMKIRHEQPVPPPGKGVDQVKTDRASVDSELALMAMADYQKESWLGNPYFNKNESFVDSGLPIVLVSRIDGLTEGTCMRMVRQPASVEKNGLWGWGVVDRGGPHAEGDKWMDKVFASMRDTGIPVYLDDWRQTLPAGFPLSRDVAFYCGWYTADANGPFTDPSFHFRPGAVAMHLHSYSASSFKTPGKGWCSTLLEKGADVTVGNVYEPFLGASHHFDVLADRLLSGYTVVEAAWMSMTVLSWQGVVFGDPLYRPYARMKSLDVVPTEQDRYFQGWWASRLQFGDRWNERYPRLLESAGKAPFSFLYEALALEFLYRKQYAQAVKMIMDGLNHVSDPRDRARLLLESLLVDRAQGGEKAFRLQVDSVRARMGSSAFLPSLEEWVKRVAPPAAVPVKNKIKAE